MNVIDGAAEKNRALPKEEQKKQGNTNISSSSNVSEELFQLCQRCESHKEWHSRKEAGTVATSSSNKISDADRASISNSSISIPEECVTLLKDIGLCLKRIITNTIKTTPEASLTVQDVAVATTKDAFHLCSFYRSFLSCGFCSNMSSLLLEQQQDNNNNKNDDDNIVWFTRIHHLLSYAIMDCSSVTLIPVLSQTIALMTELLPDISVKNALLRDWIELSWELVQVLHQRYSNNNSIHHDNNNFHLQMTIMDDAIDTFHNSVSIQKKSYILTVNSIEATQQLVYACINIILDRFLRHQQQQPSFDLTNTLLQTIQSLLQVVINNTEITTTTTKTAASISVTAIQLLYWIVSQGYLIISTTGGSSTMMRTSIVGRDDKLYYYYNTTTTACTTICTLIGSTIYNYLRKNSNRKDDSDNNSTTQDLLLISTYCNYLLPLVIYMFSADSQSNISSSSSSSSNGGGTTTMILPHTHSRRQPAILLLYQLTDCIPFFITMQKRKAEKRLVRLIFRIIHHLLVTIPPHYQIDILTHVESHGYYPILFELLLGTSTNCSNVILYGLLDPLWNMASNNNVSINSAPYTILEDVCHLVLQQPNHSKERNSAKRRKSNNNNNNNRSGETNQHSNSLLVTPPPQQNLHVHSMVTPTPKLISKYMTTKKRSHEAEHATTITSPLNPSSLRSSLEDVLSVAFHYCSQLSSWKDGEERTIYSYLSHEKDVMFELSRALQILMIGGRRNSLPPIGFTSFILESIDKLFAACATCASTLSWACSNTHQSSDKEQQQDDKTFKRILTSLIHAVFTAKHIGLLSTGGSSNSINNNNPTTTEQSKSPDAYATITSNINKNIEWIMYVAVDIWRKRWNLGIVETSYLLDSMEELSCEIMEQSRFLKNMREDTSTNSKLMSSRFCNKTCYYISAAFGVRRPAQDCLCGLITTKNPLYRKGLAVLLLEGCLPLQARCFLVACMGHNNESIPSGVQNNNVESNSAVNDSHDKGIKGMGGDSSGRIFSAVFRVVSSGLIYSSPSTMCSFLGGLCLFVDHFLLYRNHNEINTCMQQLIPSLEKILLELLPRKNVEAATMSTLRCCLLSFSSIIESVLAHWLSATLKIKRTPGDKDSSLFAASSVKKLSSVAGVSPNSFISCLKEYHNIKEISALRPTLFIMRESLHKILSCWVCNIGSSSSRPDKSEASAVRLASFKFLVGSLCFVDVDELRRLFSLYDQDVFIAKNASNRNGLESLDENSSIISNFSPSALAWVLLAPFVDNDFVVRAYAAWCFGKILQARSCSLIYLLFLHGDKSCEKSSRSSDSIEPNEWDLWKSYARKEIEDLETSNRSVMNATFMKRRRLQKLKEAAIYRFFSFIDQKMQLHCGIHFSEFEVISINSQTPFPNGTTPKKDRRAATRTNNSNVSPPPKAASSENKSFRGHQNSAVCALSSLCQYADTNTDEGSIIFQEALLRIVKFSEGQDNLRDIAFGEISRIHSIRPLHEIYSSSNLAKSFLPMLLLELIPSADESGSAASSPQHSSFHYNRIIVFINTFLLANDMEDPVDVLDYLESILPVVLPFFVINEDYQALVQFTLLRQNFQKIFGKRSRRNPDSSLDLREETAKMCAERGIIEQIVVRCLLYHNLSPFAFLLNAVFSSTITLKKLLAFREQLVLKMLIWELAGANIVECQQLEEGLLSKSDISFEDFSVYDPAEVLCALKKGALIRVQSNPKGDNENKMRDIDVLSFQLEHEKAATDECLAEWINDSFMYLLVNVAAVKQDTSSVRPLQCLLSMLHYLKATESPQYIPQILSIVNTAMNFEQHNLFVRLLAVKCLAKFVRVVLAYQVKTVGANLSTIVVSLFPVLNQNCNSNDAATVEAVSLLEDLVNGSVGNILAPFFQEVPFLPCKPELDSVRIRLRNLGIDLDTLVAQPHHSLTGIQASSQTALNDNCIDVEESEKAQRNVAALYKRLLIVAKLMQHESTSVRKAVIDHATEVLHHNRQAFSYLLGNEEVAGMAFLTVINESGGYDKNMQDGGGVISILVQTVLNRFVSEQDADCRISLATLAGEIGAIDPNRLHLSDAPRESKAKATDSEMVSWNLSQPPWKADMRQYSLQLITSHLVRALKSSPTTQDQHKISFAIQECLTFLDSFEILDSQGNAHGEKDAVSFDDSKTSSSRGNMSNWLRSALNTSGVLEIVEPFWSTSYKQLDVVATRNPPFAKSCSSYYQWISTLCRFLIEKSQTNLSSPWKALFHACRSAIRSPAGLSVAEFLLPLLVLDVMYLGDPSDSTIIVQEFADVLSMAVDLQHLRDVTNGYSEKGATSNMVRSIKYNKEDQQKAVNIVLTFRETMQSWAETEEEEQYLTSNKSEKRQPGNSSLIACSPEVTVDHIFGVLKQLPLHLCASAAAAVGMHARALRFLEIEIRESVVTNVFSDSVEFSAVRGKAEVQITDVPNTRRRENKGPGGALAPLQTNRIQAIQNLLGCLFDCDAMEAIVQESARLGLSHSVRDQIKEREVYGDWSGALRGYEQALQLRDHDVEEARDSISLSVVLDYHGALGLEFGMLRSLLELGQLESVVNQVRGLRANGQGEASTDAKRAHFSNRLDLIPLATDAAWRLGRWELLEELINDVSSIRTDSVSLETYNPDAHYQISIGKAMLAMHLKSRQEFHRSLNEAKNAVMTSLSSSARDSYARAFPSILRLHCIREIEDASQLMFSPGEIDTNCLTPEDRNLSNCISNVWNWESRLMRASYEISNVRAIVNTRVAVLRLLNFSEDEGILWLDLGRRERKQGLLNLAEASLAHAEASYSKQRISNKVAHGDMLLHKLLRKNEVQMQVAKLRYASGDSSSALRMIEPVEISAVTLVKADDKDLKEAVNSFILRQCCDGNDIPDCITGEDLYKEGSKIFGWRLLLATEWMVGLKGGSEIMDRYRLLQRLSPNWEKAHVAFARYLDSLFEARQTAAAGKVSYQALRLDDETLRAQILRSDIGCQKYLLEAMSEYGKALCLSDKHLYQALPRLLQLWFEFTSIDPSIDSDPALSVSVLREKQKNANDLMTKLAKDIPEHQFYTALPQLMSRIGHRDQITQKIVKTILKRVLTKFPQQAMWGLAWLIHSKDAQRRSTGEEIFKGAQTKLVKMGNSKMHDLLAESRDLFKWLVELAKYQPKDHRAESVHIRPWKGNVGLDEFVPPVQAALTLSSSVRGRESKVSQTDCFPAMVPRMRSFSSKIKVMLSKARPKRLTAYVVPPDRASASDSSDNTRSNSNEMQPGDIGEMHFLVKQEAKGDLRKDARLQDLNNVINRLLVCSGEGRRQRRRLQLRTFSVVCLSEDTGILQWVPNTVSLRSCVAESYNPQADPHSVRRRGARIAKFQDVSLREGFEKCQEMYFKHGNLTRATELYEEQILKAYPPVLYWWFVKRFQDSHAWFEARTRFALSAAVWSAVGSVIGLGDRHSENILIDTQNGECVHVDFDCIFDKGLNLPKPEVIPFRLTPNMIDAMGPTGWEGTYHGGLTDAMKTLRGNRDTLLSVLEPFLKDPVIDWKRQRTSQKDLKSNSDTGSLEAKRSIKVIDERLRGIYNLRNPNYRKIQRTDNYQVDPEDEMSHILPLSVEGQVHRMISEATSHENHVQLYVGWMPWV